MKQVNVILVCGYGCHLSPKIKEYLQTVAEFAQTIEEAIIITSGAATNRKTAQGISEAKIMADYLKTPLPNTLIYLDEEATTTAENIFGVKKISVQNDWQLKKVFIFCCSKRYYKVKYFAWVIFKKNYLIKKFTFNNKLSEGIKQLFIATPFDILAYHFKFFNWLKRIFKEHKMNKS